MNGEGAEVRFLALPPVDRPIGNDMSRRSPVVKGLVELCERCGCGHVFGRWRGSRWPAELSAMLISSL